MKDNKQQPLASKPAKTSPLTSSFDGLVNTALETCAGISVAVVDGDSTFSKAYGIAEFPDTPVTTDTIFYCASTTKAFTGAAASLLVDDTNHPDFQWSTPINRLIPADFVLQDEYWTNHITVEDALCHRTGLGGNMLIYDGHYSTPKDMTRALRHVPLTLVPRTQLRYCNIMYAVICHTIETVSGKWFGDFLKMSIWEPLKMDSSYFHVQDVQKDKKPLAHGYQYRLETKSFTPTPWNPISGDGAGGIFSTVLDYTKWIRSMIEQNGPLSAAGYKAVTTSQIPYGQIYPAHSDLYYGYGWVISSYHGERIIWHNGGLEGFTSMVVYLPGRKWGCVLMSNTETTTADLSLLKLKYYLIDELLQVPESERVDWDAREQTITEEAHKAFKCAKEQLYPNAAKLPTTLPLSSYVGTYEHPGAGKLTVSLKDDKLFIDGSDRTWKLKMDLEHVSGNHFLLVVQMINSQDSTFIRKMEFYVDASGVVSKMGVSFEQSTAQDLSWFDRI